MPARESRPIAANGSSPEIGGISGLPSDLPMLLPAQVRPERVNRPLATDLPDHTWRGN
jgi:hypothetical protein